jgi:hypothetical protein
VTPTLREYLKTVEEVRDIFTSFYVATFAKIAFKILVLKESVTVKHFTKDTLKKIAEPSSTPSVNHFVQVLRVQFQNVSFCY